jgi:hypothetical protein
VAYDGGSVVIYDTCCRFLDGSADGDDGVNQGMVGADENFMYE